MSPQDFWGDNYYKHPPLTDEMVKMAETRYSIILPAEYVDLLRYQNGGYTTGLVYPMTTPTSWADDHVPLNELAGIGPDVPHSCQNIMASQFFIDIWDYPPRQIMLAGDGHWFITLDYRQGNQPTVAYIDIEIGEEHQVAPTFRDFLAGLVPTAEFEKR